MWNTSSLVILTACYNDTAVFCKSIVLPYVRQGIHNRPAFEVEALILNANNANAAAFAREQLR